MKIENDKVVAVHYKVSTPDGQLVEDSHSGSPLVYLHGHDGMLKALEAAIDGKEVGDKISTLIENAYGEREDDQIQRVSIKHVMTEGKSKPKLAPGMVIYLNSDQGPQPVTVVKVGLKVLDVDTNHPYAGQDLNFDVEVIDVRDATDDELEHGHAHGEGGVQH